MTVTTQNLEPETARARKQADEAAARAEYNRRVAELKARADKGKGQSSMFKEQAALRIVELMDEPNLLGVYRLIEIFGPVAVEKADYAITLYKEAASQGPEAYATPGTAVANNLGQPRTMGGIFFYLMYGYCQQLGLNWYALRIPNMPASQAKKPVQSSPAGQPAGPKFKVQSSAEEAEARKSASSSKPANGKVVGLADKGQPEQAKPANGPAVGLEQGPVVPPKAPTLEPKPSRAKVSLAGNLLDAPKLNPQGMDGVVELAFKIEMNPALPKGLPNLGASRVVVWCTKKQYERVVKVAPLTSETRFIIEGEPVPAVSGDLSPFLRLICLKLSTVELEQAARASQNSAQERREVR